MLLPVQVLPEAEKNEKWGKDCVKAIIANANVEFAPRMGDISCYNFYYGHQNELDFEYLTGKEEFRMPAQVRFMPIAKSYFDLLVSTAESRDPEPMVYAIDNQSMDQKKNMMAEKVVDTYIDRLMVHGQELDMLRLRMNAYKQQMGSNGGDPMIAQQMEIAMKGAEGSINRGDDVLQQALTKYEREFRYTLQTQLEKRMTNGFRFLNAKYGWKEKFKQGFEDMLVVDNEIYRVEDVYEGQDPKFRRVDPLKFYYGIDPAADYVDQCPWNMEDGYEDVSRVIEEFGERLDQKDLDKLRKRRSYESNGMGYMGYYGNETSTGGAGRVDSCVGADTVYSGSGMLNSNMIRVSRVTWRSVRTLRAEEVRAKDGSDLTYTYLIGDDHEPKKQAKLIERYVTEWWEGTRIGNDIYVDVRKCPFQFRDQENIGMAYSRYIGYAYDGITKRPYSRVKAVREINILYNLVYYQLELLMALSGIRGLVMDITQKPQHMSLEEWMYYLKQGAAFINPTQTGVNGRGSNFNQFQSYDMTFGNSINQIVGILDKLEYLIGRVIGIPPQRLGEIGSNDQATTHTSAITQSERTTEVLFNKHDRLVKRVGDRMIHAATHSWRNGRRGRYVLGGIGQQMFEIAAGDLDNSSFELFYGNSGRDQMKMDRAMNLVLQDAQMRQSLSLGQLLSMFNMNTTRELEETVQYYEQVAMTQHATGVQNDQQHQQQLMQMEAQGKLLAKKTLTDGEQLQGQIDQQRLQLDRERLQTESSTKLQQQSMGDQSRERVAGQNTMVELATLQQMRHEGDLDRRLEQMRILMDGLEKSGQQISSTRPKNKPSDL